MTTMNDLPSPKDVFSGIFTNDRPEPRGLSAFFNAFLGLISLCLARQDPNKSRYTQDFSIFDLTPLYGAVASETDMVRAKDGRGMLSPDCFYADASAYPPAVSALLVLWNRNHNYIARRLLLDNQKKKWIDSFDESDPASLKEQDDDIFKTARLINCIQFMNSVETDFLKALLGQGITKSNFKTSQLALPSDKRDPAVTSLLQLLYEPKQWSPFYSQAEAEFYELQDQEVDGFGVNSDPRTRCFGGLERGFDWRFEDDKLATVLVDATGSPAGQPTPFGLGLVVQSIERCRSLGTLSLNSFRKQIGLKEYRSLEDWNGDAKVVTETKRLYSNASSLEAYIGLMAESIPASNERKNAYPILGESLSKGLVADLATFVETDAGKRLKGSITDAEITTWGVKDCTTLPDDGGRGSWIPRLLQRNLPRHYTFDSVYSLFPFFVLGKPGALRDQQAKESISSMIKELGQHPYKFDLPHTSPVKIVNTKEAVERVMNDAETYNVMYKEVIGSVSNGYDFLIATDDINHHDKDLMMTMFALLPDHNAVHRYAGYFRLAALQAISQVQYDLGKTRTDATASEPVEIDIVADVINKTCTRWVCQTLCGIDEFKKPTPRRQLRGDEPLKDRVLAQLAEFSDRSRENLTSCVSAALSHQQAMTEEEWHECFGQIYALVFRNGDPQHGWTIRKDAEEASKKLFNRVQAQMKSSVSPRYLTAHHFLGKSFLDSWVLQHVRGMAKSARDARDTIASILIEYFWGKPLPQFNSSVFLERMVKSSRRQDFSLGKATLKEPLAGLAVRMIKDQNNHPEVVHDKLPTVFQIIQREDVLQSKRVVANIVGLAMATAIQYAQTCALAVDFYLDQEREDEFKEICRLASLKGDDAIKENVNEKLMGYIREAQRIGQPFGVWRQATKDDIVPVQGASSIKVKKGDRVFVDFGTYHMSSAFENPQKIDINRKVKSLHGLGLHKCPGRGFVDNTMPELFKTIFRLKGLRRASGENGRLVRVECHSPSLPSDPRLFRKDSDSTTPYPRSLKLQFTPEPQETIEESLFKDSEAGRLQIVRAIFTMILLLIRGWVSVILSKVGLSVPSSSTSAPPPTEGSGTTKKPAQIKDEDEKMRRIIISRKKLSELRQKNNYSGDKRRRLSYIMNFALVCLVLYLILGLQAYRVFGYAGGIVFRAFGYFRHRPSRPLAKASDIKNENLACPKPQIFDSPHPEEFIPGPDSYPAPIVYTLNDRRAHRLSFVDIDEKDTRVAIWVDDTLRGITPDFEVNKTLSCGEDIGLCLKEKFSAGMVVIPGGKRTIKLEYQGNEFYPNTTDMNWGDKKSRRIMVWKEWCN